ncbi:UNVERIFIED_ORG: exopolysaccharide production protein ExoZ [Rhizobium sophorae]|uniref:acyltransferase family protein n=1 Tax=Rhizobium leguminosarum TaxID=384 RepID=UPI000DE50E91|nr:acyltransferase [Rhizobium leguminosarum]MBB4526542.1 exopolysaccharide production protein ExoZ [Rhizobium leguminosarum]MDH6663667.1 exopolysaccharide production protein ExoZ [Rhizobium sophorae]
MLTNVQSLRGLAALMVVYYHAHGLLIKRYAELGLSNEFWTREHGLTKFGALGVDIFFIISGFIIFHSTWDKDLSARSFLIHRVRRIYPVYWVATVLFVLITLLPGTSYSLSALDIFASLLLIPKYFNGDVKPVLEVGWSLYYEMFFYVMFAVMISQTRRTILLQMTVLFSLLIVMGIFVKVDLGIWKVITNERLLEFIAGGWAAYLYRTGGIRWNNYLRWASVTITVSGTIAFVLFDGWREDYSALITRAPIAVAVFSLFLFDDKLKRFISGHMMSFLGDASYSIYLFHMFPFIILSGMWKRGFAIPPFEGVATWAVLLVVGAVAGIGAHLIVERPLMSLLRGKPVFPVVSTESA